MAENNNNLWTAQLNNPAADLIAKVISKVDSAGLGSTIITYNHAPPQSAAPGLRSGSFGASRGGQGGKRGQPH